MYRKEANSHYKFFNRDISWLSFNYRVLQEAFDERLPLYERIKFLAIYSNNLEEFYRVRVSYYRSLIRELPGDHPKMDLVEPVKIMQQINKIVSRHQEEFNDLFYNKISNELRKQGIIILEYNHSLNDKQCQHVESIFNHEIFPNVQPVLLVKKRVKPFLKTGHVYLMLKLFAKIKGLKKVTRGKLPKYALIKLPTDHGVSRFIEIPSDSDNHHYIMFLEDLIMKKTDKILPGYFVDSWYSVKITRDADLEYEDYDEEDLIEVIEKISNVRAIGAPNRFQYDRRMPSNMLNYLLETFEIFPEVVVKGGITQNFRDFFDFPNPKSPQLESEQHKPLRFPPLEKSRTIFDAIENNDYLLHFPYQSFDYFIQFLNEAGIDENVTEIKTTQYRVANNSAVVNALINAALIGKKITVFVELKARFDEEANLQNAREMKKAGINIIYSLPGLKVHSKIALVYRIKDGKQLKKLAFLGTGNFNEKTAKSYCDHGFLTSDIKITDEVDHLFTYLMDQTKRCEFNHILVPNFNMVERFKDLIAQEIEHVRSGREGYMALKMNGLEDPAMITELYKASEAGVKIDLIVRGICCLVPEEPQSRNIRVMRIVDKFLEHARVYVFHNNGNPFVFAGSADWMKRNLYRRIECIFPIYDEHLKQEMIDIINIQLADNVSARHINKNLKNVKTGNGQPPFRAQREIYKYLMDKTLGA